MAEDLTKKYLNLVGLQKYDELIKQYIATADTAILNQILGEVGNEDPKTIAALNEAIKALQGTDHTHPNEDLLDTYTQTEADLADAVSKKHSHENAESLDGINDDKIKAWDEAEKNAKDYAYDLAEGLSNRTIAGVDLQNDITKEELLAALNVADGARVNVIESISVNGVDATIADKKATITIPEATTSASGVMSAADKTKLDGLANIKSVGDNLAVDTDGKLTVTIPEATVTGVKEGDSVLSLEGTLLTSAITLSYDSTAKEIYLKGKDDTVISTVNAADFIKDGMIDNVAWSTESGKETTLVITFNTDAGKEAVEVDFQKLVDKYTAGNGIDVNGQVVSVKIANATTDAVTLSADANGLSATLSGWDTLKAKVDALETTYAPFEHTHDIDDVTGLQEALNGKSDTDHKHVIADITDFETITIAEIEALFTPQNA